MTEKPLGEYIVERARRGIRTSFVGRGDGDLDVISQFPTNDKDRYRELRERLGGFSMEHLSIPLDQFLILTLERQERKYTQ